MISDQSGSWSSDNSCVYLERGWCSECTCTKCIGGQIRRVDETGHDRWHTCGCRKEAYSRWLLRSSGLERLAERCTFDSYTVNTAWQDRVKRKALDYVQHWKQNSFFISGQSGCGKTHICTAICNEIVKQGKSLVYFRWVNDATALKMRISDPELYGAEIKRLSDCDLLYIDDLLKNTPSDADLRLLYEIVNSRYNDNKPMVISSERSLSYIRDLVSDRDKTNFGEAIAGRIIEASGNGQYCIILNGDDKNVRLHPELIK